MVFGSRVSAGPSRAKSWHHDAQDAARRALARHGEPLNILGVLLVLFGAIWFLQGINVLPGSFMTGQASMDCVRRNRSDRRELGSCKSRLQTAEPLRPAPPRSDGKR